MDRTIRLPGTFHITITTNTNTRHDPQYGESVTLYDTAWAEVTCSVLSRLLSPTLVPILILSLLFFSFPTPAWRENHFSSLFSPPSSSIFASSPFPPSSPPLFLASRQSLERSETGLPARIQVGGIDYICRPRLQPVALALQSSRIRQLIASTPSYFDVC
jgi:hypothetical protein